MNRSKWMGQCPGCQGMEYICRRNSFHKEEYLLTGSGLQSGSRRAEPVVLKDIQTFRR